MDKRCWDLEELEKESEKEKERRESKLGIREEKEIKEKGEKGAADLGVCRDGLQAPCRGIQLRWQEGSAC